MIFLFLNSFFFNYKTKVSMINKEASDVFNKNPISVFILLINLLLLVKK